jgi:hypothetical protein
MLFLAPKPFLLDAKTRACLQGDATLRLSHQLGNIPVAPPNPNRLAAWEYHQILLC